MCYITKFEFIFSMMRLHSFEGIVSSLITTVIKMPCDLSSPAEGSIQLHCESCSHVLLFLSHGLTSFFSSHCRLQLTNVTSCVHNELNVLQLLSCWVKKKNAFCNCCEDFCCSNTNDGDFSSCESVEAPASRCIHY